MSHGEPCQSCREICESVEVTLDEWEDMTGSPTEWRCLQLALAPGSWRVRCKRSFQVLKTREETSYSTKGIDKIDASTLYL